MLHQGLKVGYEVFVRTRRQDREVFLESDSGLVLNFLVVPRADAPMDYLTFNNIDGFCCDYS